MAGGYVVQTAVGFSRLPAIMMVEAPAIAVASSAGARGERSLVLSPGGLLDWHKIRTIEAPD
jgi:hypothetical protein